MQAQRPPIAEVLNRYSDTLMTLKGVIGTGIGLVDDRPCIKIFIEKDDLDILAVLPEFLEGWPVDAQCTGPASPQ